MAHRPHDGSRIRRSGKTPPANNLPVHQRICPQDIDGQTRHPTLSQPIPRRLHNRNAAVKKRPQRHRHQLQSNRPAPSYPPSPPRPPAMDPPQRAGQNASFPPDRSPYRKTHPSQSTMVARITPTASLAKILTYNEEKVTQGKAEFIHAGNFLPDKNDISYTDKLHRFQQLNELNARSQVKMWHATLNF